MTYKVYNPTSPSRRFRKILDKTTLWPHGPISTLTHRVPASGGRNASGRITSYHRGSYRRNIIRKIDFKRSLLDTPGKVIRIEYDPHRSSRIALVCYKTGILSYILASSQTSVNDIVISTVGRVSTMSSVTVLRNILLGTPIHNIELWPGSGGVFCRSAGSYGTVLDKIRNEYAIIRLPSGEMRYVSLNCFASIGIVSNSNHSNQVLGKAGASRWKGRRSVVRGVAMNPIDHPHGGGQGKTSGGRPSVSPWGFPTKCGFRKAKNRNKFIISRHK